MGKAFAVCVVALSLMACEADATIMESLASEAIEEAVAAQEPQSTTTKVTATQEPQLAKTTARKELVGDGEEPMSTSAALVAHGDLNTTGRWGSTPWGMECDGSGRLVSPSEDESYVLTDKDHMTNDWCLAESKRRSDIKYQVVQSLVRYARQLDETKPTLLPLRRITTDLACPGMVEEAHRAEAQLEEDYPSLYPGFEHYMYRGGTSGDRRQRWARGVSYLNVESAASLMNDYEGAHEEILDACN